MVPGTTLEIVQDYLKKAGEMDLPVLGAWLYGSHARGEARDESDIDLLVIVEDTLSKSDFHKVWDDLMHLAWTTDVRIEPRPVRRGTFENDDASPFLEVIRQEGIPIAA